ncbi:MAG TPA: hypothetical protein VFW13_09870 [Phenylobacterium sp.]|nr:hypothetical protein [Phenylobacterium sp.]
MRSVMLAAAGLGAIVLSGAAVAQERHYELTVAPAGQSNKGFEKISVSKAAIGSSQIVIWGGAAIDPDCSPHPGSTLAIVQQPAHGSVKVVEEGVYVAFPQANPRSVCNGRKVPGRKVYYTAAEGYSGHDKVVLEGASEDGHVRHVTVDVDVRKASNG